jgi:hypothetical protein
MKLAFVIVVSGSACPQQQNVEGTWILRGNLRFFGDLRCGPLPESPSPKRPLNGQFGGKNRFFTRIGTRRSENVAQPFADRTRLRNSVTSS